MASALQHPCAAVLLAAAVLLLASPAVMRVTGCGVVEQFPADRSYANCTALATLGAALYWTYDATAATLSVAFVAAKPSSGADGAGWVAWAINPTGDGMLGAQALVALKPAGASSPYVVRTYNVTGYTTLAATSTPIAFVATGLGADESGAGKVRLYGTLQLNPSMTVFNHIWQVGSEVINGVPAMHAFAKENLEAKGTLALVAGA